MAETPAVQGGALLKGADRADAVDAPQHPPQDQQVLVVVELRRVPPWPRVEGKAEPLVMEEALARLVSAGRHHRQLVLGQLEAELVLLDDLLVAPAPGAVKLGDQRLPLVDPHLVDAVFVAVQRGGAAIAAVPLALHGIHDEARGKGLKGMRTFGHSFFSP